MKVRMAIKRITAALIVALLFSAMSLGAACELSCTLAQSQSDCHSALAQGEPSDLSSMQLSGMSAGADGMDGMSMTGMESTSSISVVSAAPEPGSAHASIGEMAPCRKQFCDDRPFASLQSSRSNARHIHSVLFVTEASRTIDISGRLRDARDDTASLRSSSVSPLSLSLRI